MAASPARIAFDIPAQRLGEGLIRIAQTAGVSIGSSDPAVTELRGHRVHGQLAVDEALRRLVRGLPVILKRIDATSWRILAAPRTTRIRLVPPAAAGPRTTEGEVVITAAKTGTYLSRYAGTAFRVDGASLSPSEQTRGSEALVERLPTLSSTHLGAGRNKLFIRGIADSSFNGPSQALVGQYLGDVRLNYNAPDPDITLYDIASVEVLEGPQGTLYGAGSLAGVIRIVPAPVVMDASGGKFSLGRSLTAHGAAGFDGAAVLNLAVTQGVGARLIAFDAVEGGYIDDAGLKRANLNRTHRYGGRLAVRVNAGDWRFDVGALIQNIATRDGQYAERGLPVLTRSSRVRQPFDNDYTLGSVTVSRDWGGTNLVSANAIVRQDADSRYDFTVDGAAVPRIFDQRNRIDLISNETRLSHRKADGGGWVIGASFIHDREKLTRALGDPSAPSRILGISNGVTEGAVFGEAGVALAPGLIGSVGARFEYAHLEGEALDRDAAIGEPRRNEKTILPSLSLSWRPRTDMLVFGRYQEGFRPGGLSIATSSSGPLIQRFHGDSVSSAETGFKWLPSSRGRIDLTVTVSHTHWENIQADLVQPGGLPFTDNIGSGRIWGLEAAFGWRPIAGVRLSAAGFANDSRLTAPSTEFAGERSYELPNVAHFGGAARIAWQHDLGGGWQLDADTAARYVGHSRLGVGPTLDLEQGDYAIANASLRIGNDRWGITFEATNLLDGKGNIFALGNPFDVAEGRQRVPPRPRTIRVGLDMRL